MFIDSLNTPFLAVLKMPHLCDTRKAAASCYWRHLGHVPENNAREAKVGITMKSIFPQVQASPVFRGSGCYAALAVRSEHSCRVTTSTVLRSI